MATMKSLHAPLQHGTRSSMDAALNFSELRIVLLGKSGEGKSSVANAILRREAFETDVDASARSGPERCERASGWMSQRRVTIITTPDLFKPGLCEEDLSQHMDCCASLSDPGPHILLLLLQMDSFTEEDVCRVERILGFFCETPSNHTVVLLTTGQQTYPYHENTPVHKFIERCKTYRLSAEYMPDKQKFIHIINRLNDVDKNNGGRWLTYERYADAQLAVLPKAIALPGSSESTMVKKFWGFGAWASGFLQRETEHKEQAGDSLKVQEDTRRMNLVLCGRRGAEKTSVGNNILGIKKSGKAQQQQHDRRWTKVRGNLVTLVEMQSLCDIRDCKEDVIRETQRCVSLCEPGVDAFIFVIANDQVADEEELTSILQIFGDKVCSYIIMLLASSHHQVEAPQKILQTNKTLHGLHGKGVKIIRCKINTNENAKDIKWLFEIISNMMKSNQGSYSSAMFLEELVKLFKSACEQMKMENQKLRDEVNSFLKMKYK